MTGSTTPTPIPIPPTAQWSWGPTRSMHGGYQGTCSVGPMNFVVVAAQDYRDAWQLNCSVTLADITLAKLTIEVAELSCTPEGLVREVAERGVLTQLAISARRYVERAAALLTEYDAISQWQADIDAPPEH